MSWVWVLASYGEQARSSKETISTREQKTQDNFDFTATILMMEIVDRSIDRSIHQPNTG